MQAIGTTGESEIHALEYFLFISRSAFQCRHPSMIMLTYNLWTSLMVPVVVVLNGTHKHNMQ